MIDHVWMNEKSAGFRISLGLKVTGSNPAGVPVRVGSASELNLPNDIATQEIFRDTRNLLKGA